MKTTAPSRKRTSRAVGEGARLFEVLVDGEPALGQDQDDDDPGAVGAEDQVKVCVQLALDGVVKKEEVDDHDGHQHLEAL